jgi:hypothetical protein
MLGPPRLLEDHESRLILLLIANSRSAFGHRVRGLRAYELDYMGGLLFDQGTSEATMSLLEQATFTTTLAHAQFVDQDRTPIEVRLDCDQFGRLYGLDIHKTNFEPVIEYPSRRTLRSRLVAAA